MKDMSIKAYIAGKQLFNKGCQSLKGMMKDERGISDVVGGVILVLVVVMLAGMFWKQLSGWFGNIWGQVTGQTFGGNTKFPK